MLTDTQSQLTARTNSCTWASRNNWCSHTTTV